MTQTRARKVLGVISSSGSAHWRWAWHTQAGRANGARSVRNERIRRQMQLARRGSVRDGRRLHDEAAERRPVQDALLVFVAEVVAAGVLEAGSTA